MRSRFLLGVTLLTGSAALAVGCVNAKAPTDTGSATGLGPTSPTPNPNPSPTPTPPIPPTPAPTQALAYNPDLKPIFAEDCLVCHSGGKPSGKYDMTSYARIMVDIKPGSASSKLVTVTQSSGSMYRYFSVDRPGRSDMVRRWVVTYNAAENR